MQKSKIQYLSTLMWILISGLITTYCAHPVLPTGGEKDVITPLYVEAQPDNYSTNFDTKKIQISFDEFIKLNDPSSEIFVSPPLNKMPTYKVRGKSVVINLEEDLLPETTYTIYFGKSIVDITEENPNSGFEYVFSTGDVIDSLSISGQVFNAFNLDHEMEILVMLYADNNDTIPFDSLHNYVKPISATQTMEDGYFTLNNLRDRDYRIFALEDANGNYIYDLPNERIAFIDSLIRPEFVPYISADSANLDTMIIDENLLEMILVRDEPDEMYLMLMFMEMDSVQKLLDDRISDGRDRFDLIFKYPVDSITLTPIDVDLQEDWYIEEKLTNRDTIFFWLKNMEHDTIMLQIAADTSYIDTMRLVLSKREIGRRPRKNQEGNKEYLTIRSKISGGIVELNKGLEIEFARPVESFDLSRFELLEDSIQIDIDFAFTDSIKRHGRIMHQWVADRSYQLTIPDSSFTDIRGLANDTTIYSFRTRDYSEYGLLDLDVSYQDYDGQMIIQLLNSQEDILRQKIINQEGHLVFEYILPGSYLLKAIKDGNNNNQWDPGEYATKTQPEAVFYFIKNVEVRSNWEMQETWQIF